MPATKKKYQSKANLMSIKKYRKNIEKLFPLKLTHRIMADNPIDPFGYISVSVDLCLKGWP